MSCMGCSKNRTLFFKEFVAFEQLSLWAVFRMDVGSYIVVTPWPLEDPCPLGSPEMGVSKHEGSS